jgi:hypothetical protein
MSMLRMIRSWLVGLKVSCLVRGRGWGWGEGWGWGRG